MALYHVPNINIQVNTRVQDLVNSLEGKLKPSEMVILLSWLTEILDWEDRKRLIMQLTKDWSNDLAEDLRDVDEDDPEDLAELNRYLVEVGSTLKEAAEMMLLTADQMEKAATALRSEGGDNATSTKVFTKR